MFMSKIMCISRASLVAQTVKTLPAMRETWLQSLGGKIPWRQEELPTQVSLPGKPHGQRILEDYSPWSLKESDMTKQLTQQVKFLFWV